MNTSGSDNADDNLSMFSESIVEREGVVKNTRLVLPEADDDAFYDLQSQRSASSMDRKSAIVIRKQSTTLEEKKNKQEQGRPGMTEVKLAET